MESGPLRLQKYLADCGVASRRACEKLIEAGRVTVNGRIARLGEKADPARDAVLLDGRPIREETEKVYILLNKPRGTVTTARDTHGRSTVLDCLDGLRTRVFPVGRLDMDVEGVLFLTNDGELAHRLTHPSYEVEKVYQAWVRGQVSEETLRRFQQGITLEDGLTAPARAEILRTRPNATLLQLTLHEGKKREVKRMCEAVGHPVESLRRIAFGNLRSGGLRPGEWRCLTPQELAALRREARLA